MRDIEVKRSCEGAAVRGTCSGPREAGSQGAGRSRASHLAFVYAYRCRRVCIGHHGGFPKSGGGAGRIRKPSSRSALRKRARCLTRSTPPPMRRRLARRPLRQRASSPRRPLRPRTSSRQPCARLARRRPRGWGFACGLRASSSGMRLQPLDAPLAVVPCTKMTISCEFSPQLSEFHPNFATFVHKSYYQG